MQKNTKNKIKYSSRIWNGLFFILFLLASQSNYIEAQTTQVAFGQNRVQYHSFDWQYYNSTNFTIYFYPGGQEIGKFVWTMAEMKLEELNKQMDFHYRSQIDILVYNDISDMAQTNIGLGQENYNIGGTTILRDNKLFLHYDGNYRHLQRDLMQGLSALYIRQMMAGKNVGQKIQNAILLSMPEWYKEGIAAYIGEPWNTELDAQLKLYLQKTKKSSFNKLATSNPTFAGHSFWYMISELYGKEAIPNILYLTRINHSVNSGLVYGVNSTLNNLMQDWKVFFQSRFENDNNNRDSTPLHAIKLKKRNNKDIGDLKISADGKHIAFAAFDGGFYKVFIQDIKTKKTKCVAKGGFHSDQYPFDKSYPILTWTKQGNKLAIISDKKDVIRLTQFDVEKKEKKKEKIVKFKRIYGADFTNNPNQLIFSGQNKGQTDLYLYNLLDKKTTQLNNDIYDDLNPVYVNYQGNDGVLFSSNRKEDKFITEKSDTILPTQTLDVFYYDLNKRGEDLARITETPFANEKPIGNYNENYYTFLSDENGITNQYIGKLDSFFVGKDSIDVTINEQTDSAQTIKQAVDIYKYKGTTFPITNFSNGIVNASTSNQKNYFFFGAKKQKKSFLYEQHKVAEDSIFSLKSFGLQPSSFRKYFKENTLFTSDFPSTNSKKKSKNKSTSESSLYVSNITMDSLYKGPFKYTFESDYNSTIATVYTEAEKKDTLLKTDSTNIENQEELPAFLQNSAVASTENVERTTGKKIRIIPYRARFSSDYVVTQLDNSILTQNYQSFKQNGGNYNFPTLSGMINFGISDLMEDHKVLGGFRIPLDFKGMEAYVKYINLKKRIDKSVLFYYRSDKVYYPVPDTVLTNYSSYPGRSKTYFTEAAFSYPFDVTKSLRWSVSYRNEQLHKSFFDSYTLNEKDIKENWVSARAEFVHDNTKEIQFNILNGFRYKFFAEYFFNLNNKKSNLVNIGFDIRHYQKIYKNVIWANRFSGASSFGQQKIVYFLGGVDTWLNPKYDYSIPVAQNQNYAFQAPVTNMRGLPQNIRNGNNYLLWNSEFRLPLFSLIAKKPLKSAFLRDFQLVSFFDAGIAYNLANPFNKDNSISKEQVTSNANSIIVTVNYYRNPFVFGTGAGLRTNILGYFIRLDSGFGYDGLQFNKKPIWHFSLSKDF